MRNTEPRHINLKTLIEQLKEGHFVIPDFQREFKWNPQDIRDFMCSIFLDCHIGSFLLWEGKENNFKLLSCKNIYGFNEKTEQIPRNKDPRTPKYIVLDGQQRLTALYYAFFAPDVLLPKSKIKNRVVYFVHVDKFMDKCYSESFRYYWRQPRSEKIINDRKFQYEKHIFPLSIIGDGDCDLRDWVRNYEEYWKKIADEAKARQDISECESAKQSIKNVHKFRLHIKSIVEEYQIAYIKLGKDLAIDKICNIFTQANSHGVQLNVFDFISALLKPKGLQLEQMCHETWPEEELKPLGIKEGKMKAYVLQTMSILLQKHCSAEYLYFLLPGREKQICDPKGNLKKKILIPGTNSFKKYWDDAVSAIKEAIKMLENPKEFGGISSKYFPPSLSILPVFAALQFEWQQLHSDLQLEAQRKIRHWYWASVFTNRYSKYSISVESTSARDFIDVMAWVNNHKGEPALIQEFKDQFRSIDLRNETKKGTPVYNSIFNLLILKGAKDWMEDNILLQQHKDLLNDHHIVPASWGKKNLNNSNSIDTILNRTPLTVKTNRAIDNRLPNKYLKKLIKEKGEKKVYAILESHFISPKALSFLLKNSFTQKDYEEFINIRQRIIIKAIKSLLSKKQLHL